MDLATQTKPELIKLCKELKIKNYSNKKKYLPSLDISNAIILNNSNDYIEPPSYREVSDEGSIFYKKTMLFDTLIPKPRL